MSRKVPLICRYTESKIVTEFDLDFDFIYFAHFYLDHGAASPDKPMPLTWASRPFGECSWLWGTMLRKSITDGGLPDAVNADYPEDVELAHATSAQRGLWLTYLLDESSLAYHVSHAFRVSGPLNVAVLRDCLTELRRRHEALRTSFLLEGDELYQVIRTSVAPAAALNCVAIAGAESVEDYVRREFAAPFDLSEPSLFRATLLSYSDSEHVLVLAAHHMIVDAQSIAIILVELSQLYNAGVAGVPVELSEPPIQLGDYANWELGWIESPGYTQQLEFFRRRLAGAPRAIDLPLPRRHTAAWRGGIASLRLDSAVTSTLLATATRLRTTPFVALLTVFAGVLHRWSGQDSVVVGTSMSLRAEPGLERAVGMFINSVPLPTTWSDDPSFEQALGRVRGTVLDCLTQYRCPFDRLVADLRPARDPSRAPIFQVMFGLVSQSTTEPEFDGLTVAPIGFPSETSKFELNLDVTLTGSELICDLEWSSQYFNEDSAACLVEHLGAAARRVAADPSRQVGQWLSDLDQDAGEAKVSPLGDAACLAAPYAAMPASA